MPCLSSERRGGRGRGAAVEEEARIGYATRMRSSWSDEEAAAEVRRLQGAGEAVALRVYTSRLIGREPGLVLHGGGNTSVKVRGVDLLGREIDVLHVKGSGWDLADIEPDGLPALRLDPLRELQALEDLSDRAMVAALRSAMLDPSGPAPSVETLLHAFLPHAFVDHTHADAIAALTDQPDGEALARQALGGRVAVLPWIMPGFPLAKAVADAFARDPSVEGIVLQKHGLFTFGRSARESYERMISLVDRAERFLEQRIGGVPSMLAGRPEPLPLPERERLLAGLLPVLRGAAATRQSWPGGERWRRVVADARRDDDLAAFASHGRAEALCASGPITPDHVIRTKGRYLYLTIEQASDAAAVRRAVEDYAGWYESYFERCAKPLGNDVMLASAPCVAVVEGCGLVALQPTARASRIAADIAEHTLRVWAAGTDLGTFEPLPEAELARMEYWPLELAKLGRRKAPLLEGQVAWISGGAGAIGCGIAEVLLENGAAVCLVDVDPGRLDGAAERLGKRPELETLVADLTDPEQVASAFARCALRFGGVDVVVPNAGIAHASRLEDMDASAFARVMDVNAKGTMLVLKEAARIFRAQGTGGSVVLQASKNAFAPGAGFGAYSASKAAALQLGRIAAIEFAELGVCVNMINADAVFGDEKTPSRLWEQVGPERMRARNLDPEGLRAYYRDRSLLKVPVLPRHVGEAVLFFAAGRTPTTGAVLPVDGGLPEAFPR
ncbi:MAG: bifunctional aldolase/short-chain dehydrogenase [Planctomycetota bacterium]